jgi:23S rRNA pseudouridine1911/1915/1917 synthase
VAPAVVHDGAGELVVVKPAGLPCETPRDPAADSLVRRLAAVGHRDLRLVHRLDAPACGLVLLARSSTSAAFHAGEIGARRWRKWYVARVAASAADAHRLIGAHKTYLKTAGRAARVVRAGGKPAFLDVVHAAPAPDERGESHVLVQLHTGRYHQIRAMLAHLGAPLAGDVRYGGRPGRMYLEHVVLGAGTFGSGVWTVWQAPPHADRDSWATPLADAVAAVITTARTAPPRPARVP